MPISRRSQSARPDTIELTLLLVPQFSMLSLASVLETTRIANRLSKRDAIRVTLVSENGSPVISSLGVDMGVEHGLFTPRPGSILLVCGGTDIVAQTANSVLSWLRRCASHGVRVGGLCTGTYLLARAGIIRDRLVSIHWEHHDSLREEMPDIALSRAPYVLDDQILSAAGGTSGIDLILELIAESGDRMLSREVAKQLNYLDLHDMQRFTDETAGHRAPVRNPRLLKVMSEMEQTVEEPRPVDYFSQIAGVSTRQLERLFLSQVGETPSQYYLRLRLDRALRLLVQTEMPVLNVALATGFSSQTALAAKFRKRFGKSPRDLRR